MWLTRMHKLKNILGKFRPYNGIKTPIVLQQSETECGIVALTILFSYFHHHVPFERLREQCGTSRDGCKALTLMHVAKIHGFNVDAFRVELEDLRNLKIPVIAFWNFSHYVVINGVGTDKVFINDPAHGPLSVSLDLFDKLFTGVIIALRPAQSLPPTSKPAVVLPMLFEWLQSYYLELTCLLLFILISVCGTLGQTFLSSLITVEYMTLNVDFLNRITLVFLIWGLFFSVFVAAQKWYHFTLYAKASLVKSTSVIAHALQLPYIFYTLRQKSEIVAVLNRCDFVVSLLYKGVTYFCANILMLMACLLTMYKINKILVCISAITCILSAVGLFLTTKSTQLYDRANTHLYGKLYGHTVASIKNLETIIACGFETITLKKWQALFVKKLLNQSTLATIKTLLNVAQSGNHNFSTLIIFYLATLQIVNGQLSLGGLMAYYLIHLYTSGLISSLVVSVQDMQKAHFSHIRIKDVMQYPADKRYDVSKFPTEKKEPGTVMRCESVYFFYNKTQPPALSNITCEIKSGEHIAIVGATGSGKSTLAKVLASLYQPDAGSIFLYGHSISHYPTEVLAQCIAYVSQDVALFSGTIYDNLTLWKNTFSAQQINHVLEVACLKEVIAARGLQANIGEEGRNLSGGEKQRIEIARALLQNTPLLIFDEATAALDQKTERSIINHLKQRNQTIIFVAHRLSTIAHCDQIWVMERGSIVEQGNHIQLIEKNGWYHNLLHHAEGIK